MSADHIPSKKEVPEHLVKALAQANGICTACFGKKVLPARIQWTDGRPCSIEERPLPAVSAMNEQLVFLLRTLIGCPTITDDIRQQARDQIARLVPETVSPPQVRRFRPMIEGGHIRSMAEIGNPNGVGGWNAEYVLASDYDELTRGELKAAAPRDANGNPISEGDQRWHLDPPV